jgi:hypothetical protein
MPLSKKMQYDHAAVETIPEVTSLLALKASKLPLPTRIAFIGNYLPRECGIATFTTDLCTAIAGEYGEERLFTIPVNDPDSNYDYPKQVRLEITQEDIASYERAADLRRRRRKPHINIAAQAKDAACHNTAYGFA